MDFGCLGGPNLNCATFQLLDFGVRKNGRVAKGAGHGIYTETTVPHNYAPWARGGQICTRSAKGHMYKWVCGKSRAGRWRKSRDLSKQEEEEEEEAEEEEEGRCESAKRPYISL